MMRPSRSTPLRKYVEAVEEVFTEVAVGNLPAGGYTSRLSTTALEGKRLGLYGIGWTRRRLAAEPQALYQAATSVIEQQGAVLIDDPFLDTDFHRLFDDPDFRGFESVVYDFEQYLDRLLDSPADNSINELKATTGVDLFGPDGPLRISSVRASWRLIAAPRLRAYQSDRAIQGRARRRSREAAS